MADRWARRLYAQEFSANFSVLAADAADTPLPVVMGASTILARLATGGIVAATKSQVRTLLDVLDIGGVIQPMSYLSKSVAGAADVTLSDSEAAAYVLKFTGTLTGGISVILPLTAGRSWVVWNATDGAFTLAVKGSTGSSVTVTQGKRVILWTDGTGFYVGQDDSGATAGDLDGLSDVSISSIASGHVLYYNGSAWVNDDPGPDSGVQPYDADLSAIGGLSSTGIAVRTAANTWAQRVVADAGSGRVSVTNPGGVGGDITLDVVEASLAINNIGGTLGLAKGGTNASLSADNGGIVYSTASALGILPSTSSAGKPLVSGASGAPSWASYQANFTVTRGGIPCGSAAHVLSMLAVGGADYVLGSDGTDAAWVQSTGTGNVVRANSPTIASPTITGTAIFNTTAQILTTDPIITVNDNQSGQDWGIEGEATDDVTKAFLWDNSHYDFAYFNAGARVGRFSITYEGSGPPSGAPGMYGNGTNVAYGSSYVDKTNFHVYDYVKYS